MFGRFNTHQCDKVPRGHFCSLQNQNISREFSPLWTYSQEKSCQQQRLDINIILRQPSRWRNWILDSQHSRSDGYCRRLDIQNILRFRFSNSFKFSLFLKCVPFLYWIFKVVFSITAQSVLRKTNISKIITAVFLLKFEEEKKYE